MTFPAHSHTKATLAPLLSGAKGAALPAQEAIVEGLLATAEDLLDDACEVTFRTIPAGVADELILRVVRALWDSRKTASTAQFTENGGEQGPRAPRDPLATSEAILARYVVPL